MRIKSCVTDSLLALSSYSQLSVTLRTEVAGNPAQLAVIVRSDACDVNGRKLFALGFVNRTARWHTDLEPPRDQAPAGDDDRSLRPLSPEKLATDLQHLR